MFASVKGLTAILTIYLFALIITPCEDSEYHHDDTSTTIEHVYDGSHASELCSPFCADHDCHTHITVSFVNSMSVPYQFVKPVNVEVTASIPTPFFAIWQPPKIS